MHIFVFRNLSNIIENIKEWIKKYKLYLIIELVCFLLMIALSVSMVIKNTNCLALEKMTNSNLYCFLICKKSFFDFFICCVFNFFILILINCLCFCHSFGKYISLVITSIFVFKLFYDISLIICLINIIGVLFSVLCLLIVNVLFLCLIIILQLSLLEKLESSCGFNFCYDYKFIFSLFVVGVIIILVQCILISIFLPILNLIV